MDIYISLIEKYNKILCYLEMDKFTDCLTASTDSVGVLIDSMALVVQILGIYYVVLNLKLLKNQLSLSKQAHQDTLLWNKKMATENELANRPNIQIVKRLLEAFGEWKDDTIPLEIILNKIDLDKSLEGNIAHLLNRYERLARGVLNDYYDSDVVMKAVKGRLLRIFKRYSNYIEYVRMTKNPAAWEQYCLLVEKWNSNNSLEM